MFAKNSPMLTHSDKEVAGMFEVHGVNDHVVLGEKGFQVGVVGMVVRSRVDYGLSVRSRKATTFGQASPRALALASADPPPRASTRSSVEPPARSCPASG